ncbi:MAG: MoaD/ThiS family protein [Promethearchaeota archaeon]|jgi:molybdopterin synthase sulfur carrier subunit
MLNVKILFWSLLTDITGVEEISFLSDEGSDVETILGQLVLKFGSKFEEIVFKDSKNLSKYVLITINGEDIRSLDGLATKIQSEDEISLIPAIAGG